MAKRNDNGQFSGRDSVNDADDKTLKEEDFRANSDAVNGLRAYLASDSGIALRMVLREKRRRLVQVVNVKADEAAAQLAKIQAFEQFVELLIEKLPQAIEPPLPPQSRKGGAQPRINVAVMP